MKCLLDLRKDNICYNNYCQEAVRDNGYMPESIRLRQKPEAFATLLRRPFTQSGKLKSGGRLGCRPSCADSPVQFHGLGLWCRVLDQAAAMDSRVRRGYPVWI